MTACGQDDSAHTILKSEKIIPIASKLVAIDRKNNVSREGGSKDVFLKADKICKTYITSNTLNRTQTDELSNLLSEKYNAIWCQTEPKVFTRISFGETCGRTLLEKYIGQRNDNIPADAFRKILPRNYKIRKFDLRNGPALGTLEKRTDRVNIYISKDGLIDKLECG